MVSKVTVIALVAVIAVPILLGYAFNLEETTETGFKASGDEVNVSPLLQNGIKYTYSQANIYRLNTTFSSGGSTPYPIYSMSNTKSSLFLQKDVITGKPWDMTLSLTNEYSVIIEGSDVNNYVGVNIYWLDEDNHGTLVRTIDRLLYVDYPQNADNTVGYSYYDNNTGNVVPGSYQHQKIHLQYFTVGSFTGTSYIEYYIKGTNTDTSNGWVDFSKGYTMIENSPWSITLPTHTNTALMTIDLDSITDSSYSVKLGPHSYYTLTKSTDSEGVHWIATSVSDPLSYQELYYDDSISHNTYQIYFEITKIGNTATHKQFNILTEFRYVGDWTKIIGEANIYQTYSFNQIVGTALANPDLDLERIDVWDTSTGITPLIRMDAATFRAFEYPAIENKTYTPSEFRSNPITTIKNIDIYGQSIVFAGNTYTVNNGKITLDGHSIPIDGLVFSSIPDGSGRYDNKIGNTVISNTSVPSTITLNGSWSASISTDSAESYTVTKTEWVAGEFAWDGIDHNFLIVGLITCLGVFIGCGIYARRSRSGGVIPLMIVTGCAAFLFFIML